MSKGIRPEVYRDSLGVVVHSVKELRACEFGQFANTVLGDAGLMMCTNATKCNGLVTCTDCLAKSSGVEDAIVSMACFYF